MKKNVFKELIGMFRDEAGKLSMMRFMSFIVLVVVVIIIFKLAFAVLSTPEIAEHTLTFLFKVIALLIVAAFIPKTLQKIIENWFGKKDKKWEK